MDHMRASQCDFLVEMWKAPNHELLQFQDESRQENTVETTKVLLWPLSGLTNNQTSLGIRSVRAAHYSKIRTVPKSYGIKSRGVQPTLKQHMANIHQNQTRVRASVNTPVTYVIIIIIIRQNMLSSQESVPDFAFRTSTYHTWSDRVHCTCEMLPWFSPHINKYASKYIDYKHWYTSRRHFCSKTMNCMHSMRVRGLCVRVSVYCSAAAIFDKALANSFSMVRIGPMPLRHKQNSNLFRRQVKLFRWIIRKFIYKILMVAIKSLRSSFAHTSDANERIAPELTEHRSVENLFLKFILALCSAMCVCAMCDVGIN